MRLIEQLREADPLTCVYNRLGLWLKTVITTVRVC